MKLPVKGPLASEPLGLFMAIGIVVSWLLHTYVPAMSDEIVSAVSILVIGLVRPLVTPAGRALTSATSSVSSKVGAGVLAFMLLAPTLSYAQGGLPDALGQIVGQAAREGIDRLEEQVDRLDPPAEDPVPVRQAVAVAEVDSGMNLRPVDFAFMGLLALAVMFIAFIWQRGPPGAADLVVTDKQNNRMKFLLWMWIISFSLGSLIQHLEGVFKGHAAVLNQAHQNIGFLEAVLLATLVLFGIIDRYLLRSCTISELMHGRADPGREDVYEEMAEPMRRCVLTGLFGLWIVLVYARAFNVGL